MQGLSEESFRMLLDERGVLRPGNVALPDRNLCYAIFSQSPDGRLDLPRLKQHAERFFRAKLGLTVDKAYTSEPVFTDVARTVLFADDGETSGTRVIACRRTEGEDLQRAAESEERRGGGGLAQLAQRCPMLWLVVPELPEDRTALMLAAIMASVMLGPILTPTTDGQSEIFGVRTARLELERSARPYR